MSPGPLLPPSECDLKHRPAVPILLAARACRGDPEALAKGVGDGQSVDVRQSARRQRERDQEPVIRVDQRELHQQKLRQVRCGRLHGTKISLAVLERPPARIGHALECDRRRQQGADRHLFTRIGRAAETAGREIEGVPIQPAFGILLGLQHLLLTFPGHRAGELIFEIRRLPGVFARRLGVQCGEPTLELVSQGIQAALVARHGQRDPIRGMTARGRKMRVQIAAVDRAPGQRRILLPRLPMRIHIVRASHPAAAA